MSKFGGFFTKLSLEETVNGVFKVLENAPGLPLEKCTEKELETWTDVICAIIIRTTPGNFQSLTVKAVDEAQRTERPTSKKDCRCPDCRQWNQALDAVVVALQKEARKRFDFLDGSVNDIIEELRK